MIKQFNKKFKNQFDKKINVLRSDKDGKYKASFGEFCSQNGIIHQTIAFYSSYKMTLWNVKPNIKRNNVRLISSRAP